jgi:F-type H+-transporting ATPase subunit b
MDLNLTLLGEVITFIVLVWFTLKFIWPPLSKAMAERQQKIADGLAAATRGKHSLELARQKISAQFQQAKVTLAEMHIKAEQQVATMIENGKMKAKQEEDRITAYAKSNLEQEIMRSKKHLQDTTLEAAIKIAESILKKNLDIEQQKLLLSKALALLEEV